MLAKIEQPGTGRRFIMGRKTPITRGPHLRLRNYLLKSLPPPPPSIDYSQKPMAFLDDILGNDLCGDCTVAAAYHIGGTLLGNADEAIPYSAGDALSLYKQLSGWNGVEDDQSDTGLDEITVLNYWTETGLSDGQHKLDCGRISVDATNKDEVQTALWLFENLYLAVALPNKWVNPMPNQNGFVWDYVGTPNPNNGHAYCSMGYNADGVQIDTWGLQGTETYAALAQYAIAQQGGALYACLSSDILVKATGKAPVGFDITQLKADLQAVGMS